MRNTTRLLWLALLILLWFVSNAFAAAAGVPQPDTDAAGWAKALYEAATSGEWKIVGGLGLVGLTFGLRTYGARLVPWFATKLGGAILSFAISISATFGLAMATGAPFTLASVAAALGTAATAAGIWEWIKSMLPKAEASNEATKAAALPKATALK